MRVPLSRQTVNVNQMPNARIGTRATPDDFGAQIGRAAQQAGEAVSLAGAQMVERARNGLRAEFMRKATEQSLALEQAAKQREGHDATNATKEAIEAFDSWAGEQNQALADPELQAEIANRTKEMRTRLE